MMLLSTTTYLVSKCSQQSHFWYNRENPTWRHICLLFLSLHPAHPQTGGVGGNVVKWDLRDHLAEAGRAPANVIWASQRKSSMASWRWGREESTLPPAWPGVRSRRGILCCRGWREPWSGARRAVSEVHAWDTFTGSGGRRRTWSYNYLLKMKCILTTQWSDRQRKICNNQTLMRRVGRWDRRQVCWCTSWDNQ